MTAKQASTRVILAKFEGPTCFVDINKGVSRKKRLTYQEEQHQKEEAKGKGC